VKPAKLENSLGESVSPTSSRGMDDLFVLGEWGEGAIHENGEWRTQRTGQFSWNWIVWLALARFCPLYGVSLALVQMQRP